MKVSLLWLRDYVDVELAPAELAHRLSMAGLEVAAVQAVGGDWDNVFVAQIVALRRHPNADRLLLADVDLGAERITVVTGAPNLAAGQKVPFAKVGAQLIDGHSGEIAVLRPARIRGVASEGMVCSEKELGISDDHSGIMILADDAPVGVPLADYLGDVILDFDITPNRPDCLSVLGVAREVAALTGQRVREPDLTYPVGGEPIDGVMAVDILDPDLCRRYTASLVRGVRVGPSPRWLQERLLAAGQRPINNVVDITNYVMLEVGQPLHSFDYDALRGRQTATLSSGRIIVRPANRGETMRTLDGVERALSDDMIVIAGVEGAVALGGVMGGYESEVIEGTTSVLLEAANFDPSSIRRTSRRLRLVSESSLRFEKGLPVEFPLLGLRRATKLLVELCGGTAAPGVLDAFPRPEPQRSVAFSGADLRRILGVAMDADSIRRPLEALGFGVSVVGRQSRLLATETPEPLLMVDIPYWRRDVNLIEDVAEEVARIVGYDDLPTTLPAGVLPTEGPEPSTESLRQLRDAARGLMVSAGGQEVITYSLVGLDALRAALGRRLDSGERRLDVEPLRMANPMSAEQEYLRTSLRPGLLRTLARNWRQAPSLRLFEVGRVYLPRPADLPEERETLAAVLWGARDEPSWRGDGSRMDFYDAKGIVEALLARLDVGDADYAATDDAGLQSGCTARVRVGGETVGVIGEVSREVAEAFDLPLGPSDGRIGPVAFFELDLARLLPSFQGRIGSARRYQALSRYPASQRDLAIVVDDATPAGRVEALLRQSPLVVSVGLFDLYRGEQLPSGKKSLAFHLVYQSPERTLTDAEVEAAQRALLDRLATELGATLR